MSKKSDAQVDSFRELFHELQQAAHQLSQSSEASEEIVTSSGAEFTEAERAAYLFSQRGVREAEARLDRLWKRIKPLLQRYHSAENSHLYAALDRVPDRILPEFVNERVALVEQILATHKSAVRGGGSRSAPVVALRPSETRQPPEPSQHTSGPRVVPPRRQSDRNGKWVTAKVYAQIHDLSEQSLANKRYKDRLAGRDGAPPGEPRYRKYGGAVRYWLEEEPQ